MVATSLTFLLAVILACQNGSIDAFLPLLPQTNLHSSSSHFHSWQGDFDYSSTSGWEEYYQHEPTAVKEWHSSIPPESLADLVPQMCNCLMIGTGTSRLPQVVQARRQAKITLLDSSMTCIEQLKQRYGNSMKYVCGDATKLSSLLVTIDSDNHESFEMIIDKGLMDALLCGGGWDLPISALLQEAAKVLRPRGSYLLISYQLPTSTQEFLREVGEQVGLEWQFNLPTSNDRVGVSIAHKV